MEMNPTIYVHGLTVRFAMTLEEIAGRAPGQTRRKSGQVSVVVRRADPRTGRWLFDAVTVGPDRSGGPYRVRVRVAKETRNPESERLLEKDIEVSCSCPAWRFWGSDYWASVHRYLWAPGSNVPNFFPDWPKPGRSFSDRSYPGLRDPGGQNGICKHVAAALGQMRDYAVPAPAVSPEDRPGQPRPGTASDNLWRKLGAADIKSYMQDKYGVAGGCRGDGGRAEPVVRQPEHVREPAGTGRCPSDAGQGDVRRCAAGHGAGRQERGIPEGV